MNYPVWDIPSFGTSLLIALVAVIHVYVAHFAIGGGLFLFVTEIKGHRENSPAILDFVKRHAKLFLLISMVFGAVTGVGIWFTISVIHPSATSTLIHSFVFGWATEWVFFLGEIIALFVYVYTFDKMEPKAHVRIGVLYFIFAWLSLFVINGIITVMLTPGQWVVNGNFWSGFFNPTMWPSLVFRTFLCLMIAGLFGFLTSTRLKDKETSRTLCVYCAKWLIIPLVLLVPAGYWYLSAIPEGPRALLQGGSPEMHPFIAAMALSAPLLLLGGVFMALKIPKGIKRPLAFVLLLLGLVYMGGFECIREASRRPFIIPGHTYSNGVRLGDEATLNKNGFLASAKWTKNKTITDKNHLEAGKELFKHQCQSCHTVGGLTNDIIKHTNGYTLARLDSKLAGLNKVGGYMPPFFGTSKERHALAEYIAGLHGVSPDRPSQVENKPVPSSLHPSTFVNDNDEWVLLAWDSGEIQWQLIKRGETPSIVTDNIEIKTRREADGILTVEAFDKKSSKRLAKTKIVSANPGNPDCSSCHGPQGADILAVHDRIEGTAINAGQNYSQVDCGKCHKNVSASLHGWHANFLTYNDSSGCSSCHLNSEHSFVGVHRARAGMDCTSCHGQLKGAPVNSAPDCLHCHEDFDEPQRDEIAGNKTDKSFKNRTDDAGLYCAACHGTPHSVNPLPLGVDNSCDVCHKIEMTDSIHHME